MAIVCSQGHSNPDGSAFCDECGERLDGGSAVSTAAAPVASAPVVTSAPVGSASPRLIIQADNAVVDLRGKSEALVGREDPVSNVYPDVDMTPHNGEEGGVSRIHAKILINGNQYMLEDQNSTNSTFVNRQKLAPKTPTPIKDGDELRFGRVVTIFRTS
ncbi:MAG: FHA domain-containing protein [Ktedonobacterales bacterium]